MYKVICRNLGFDCDFELKNPNKISMINSLSKHLKNNHNIYYPKNEISEFVDKQNNIDYDHNLESNREFDALHVKKEFAWRKNFP